MPNTSTTAATSSTQRSLLEPIERNDRQLDAGFNKAYAACQNAQQRAELRGTLGAAEDVYWAAVATLLADNSGFFVKAIRDDLKQRNDEVKDRLKSLTDIVAFLKVATEATRLAAALVRLAAV